MTSSPSEFGNPDDPRRTLWNILIRQFLRSDGGVDWNEALDEAEDTGLGRVWAHKELKRRLRWGDIHLFDGDLYPHHGGRDLPVVEE